MLSRRTFAKAAAAIPGFFVASQPAFPQSLSAGERLNLGIIGTAHRGGENLKGVKSENIVALCDVDETLLAKAAEQHPGAKKYRDWRKMLDRKDIDAVVISTPDHTHVHPTLAALELGKPVYCEKPLTHNVYEARLVARAAARAKKPTQMGTQIHATENYRRVVESVQAGAIGAVRRVHVWCGGSYHGGDRPKDTPPVPAGLDWELWLGPAPHRPYHPAYHPFNWRGWWDFGGGMLADMACHHMDVAFWALGLRHPQTVAAEGPPDHPESPPKWLVVDYEYAARGARPPVRLTWYHGDRRPAEFAEGKLPKWGNGVLFVGDKGMLLTDYNSHRLLPEERFKGLVPPEKTIAPSIGHHQEWIKACKEGGPTLCNFDYAGALTEAVLLGNVAYRTGKKLDWDPAALAASNAPEAQRYIRREYRKGWAL